MIEDEKGRICDIDTVCRGLGIHYHCYNCWKPGGYMGCIYEGVRLCDGKIMWERNA